MYYYNYNNYNTLIHKKLMFNILYILEYIINKLPISYK